jgi:hypothetical protein
MSAGDVSLGRGLDAWHVLVAGGGGGFMQVCYKIIFDFGLEFKD